MKNWWKYFAKNNFILLIGQFVIHSATALFFWQICLYYHSM